MTETKIQLSVVAVCHHVVNKYESHIALRLKDSASFHQLEYDSYSIPTFISYPGHELPQLYAAFRRALKLSGAL